MLLMLAGIGMAASCAILGASKPSRLTPHYLSLSHASMPLSLYPSPPHPPLHTPTDKQNPPLPMCCGVTRAGYYFYMKDHDYEMSGILAVLMVILYMAFFSLGLAAVPWCVLDVPCLICCV